MLFKKSVTCGLLDGIKVGFVDGLLDGIKVGFVDGLLDGITVGFIDGLLDGPTVGHEVVGCKDGCKVGEMEG